MQKLSHLRAKIDDIDTRILSLLAKRQLKSVEIARIKAECGLSVHDFRREEQALKKRLALAVKLGINTLFVTSLFRRLFTISRNLQKKTISSLTNKTKIDKIYR
jgi:chorismate mutase